MVDGWSDTLIVHHKVRELRTHFLASGIGFLAGSLILSLGLLFLGNGFLGQIFLGFGFIGLFLIGGSIGLGWVMRELMPE